LTTTALSFVSTGAKAWVQYAALQKTDKTTKQQQPKTALERAVFLRAVLKGQIVNILVVATYMWSLE
jgi:hypothetical protein